MSNIVGIPNSGSLAKTTFSAKTPEKVSRDKISEILLYNSDSLSLGSIRKKENPLYISEIVYKTGDSIAGLELSYVSKGYKVVDIVYKWENRDTQANIRSYLTQVSRANKKIISYYNPDAITGSLFNSSSYIASDEDNDNTLFFVLLEKVTEDGFFNITSDFKCVKNMNPPTSPVLSPVPSLSNWSPIDAFGADALTNSSFIKRTAQISITNLYDESLDIDGELNTVDVLDVVGICNYRYFTLNPNADYTNNKKYVPSYIDLETSTVSSADLGGAEMIIKDVIIQNSPTGEFFNLAIDIGFKSGVDSHGWQFDIGKSWNSYSFVNKKDNSVINPNVVFKGQLNDLKEHYDYRVVSVDNRFGFDNLTRVSVYRKPFNGEDPSALVDVSRQSILLNSHGVKPRLNSETLVRLEWNNISKSSNLDYNPRKRFFVKKDTKNTSENIDSNLSTLKAGEEWFGEVNYDIETSRWYSGKEFNPLSSIELSVSWDLFDILNRKAISNNSLSFIKHYRKTEQELLNFSYQFVYPEEGVTADKNVLENYDGNYSTYAESVLGYVNSVIMNGLSSGVYSKYDYEPIVPTGYEAGYMNDHDLSGTKNIVDTSALSNMFTIRMSTDSSIDRAIKDIIDNKVTPGAKNANDASNKKITTAESLTRRELDPLNKVVPALLINENSTLTYPQFEPTIVGNNLDGSVLFFTEAIECSPTTLPKEFRSWKQYFSEMYDIPHHKIPKRENFFFTQVNLATNSEKAKFLQEASFTLEFSMGFEAFLEGWGNEFYDHSGNGAIAGMFVFRGTSCDLLSGFADEYSLQGGPSEADVEVTNLHVRVSFGELGAAVSNDGGAMNLLNLFVYVDDDGSIDLPDLISKGDIGIQIKESTPNEIYTNSKVVWSEIPRNPSAFEEYTESLDNGLLYYGPKFTHKNFFLKDNSASKRTYDDVDIFLQVENKREITVKTLSGIRHSTGSFDLALSSPDEINISSFSSSFDYDSPIKLTGSLQAWHFAYSSSSDITGLSEIGRIKFSEDVFGDSILDSDPNVEVIYPSIGKNKTLVAPKVKEGYVYPSWKQCIVHSDASEPNFSKLDNSGEIIELSNAFSTSSFRQDGSHDLPILNNQNDFGNSLKSVYFTNGKKLVNEQVFDYDSSSGVSLLFNCNIDYKPLNDRLMAEDPPWNADILDNRTSIVNMFLESSDLPNTTFTSSIYFSEEQENRVQYDYFIDVFESTAPGWLEQFLISGSIYALKESYDSNGLLVKSVITDEDLNQGLEISENTKYFFNSYGNWLDNADDPTIEEPNGNEGFYSFSELTSSNTPLTGGFPYWYFTVNEEGTLLFSSASSDPTDIIEHDESWTGILAQWFAAGLGLIYNDSSKIDEPENNYEIATNFISYFWNDSTKDNIRLKNSSTGDFVYIRDANGKILANRNRSFIACENVIASSSIGGTYNGYEKAKVYLPSDYEVLNNDYLPDSNKELVNVPYNIELSSIKLGTSGPSHFNFKINGKTYAQINVPTSSYIPFSNNVFDANNDTEMTCTIEMGYAKNNYQIVFDPDDVLDGETGDDIVVDTRAYDNLKFSIGEINVFNNDLTSKELELMNASMMYKWGFQRYLLSSNRYYDVVPNIINAKFSDEREHPDKLAIDARRSYVRAKNFTSDSTRYSGELVSNTMQILSASFQDGIGGFGNLDMSTFNNRTLLNQFELTSAEDSRIFISKWDASEGLVELSYRSNKKVDAFQVEFGNFIEDSGNYIISNGASGIGIIDTFSSDSMNERKWGTPVIGKGPGTYPDERINKIIYATSPSIFKDPAGPYPSRALGSYPLSATNKGESIHLCTIKVDPSAFKGIPIIEDFSIVSSDELTTPEVTFLGTTSGDGIISLTGSLKEVEDLVRSGYYEVEGNVTEIDTLAETYDSNGDNHVDVVDYISVRNHIVLNPIDSALQSSQEFVPISFTSSYTQLPDYAVSAILSTDATAVSSSVSWNMQIGGDPADVFQVWRRSINVNQQSAQSGIWSFLASLSGSTYIDQDPPLNRLAKTQEDNPEFQYLLVAVNKYGTSAVTSSLVQFPANFSGNLLVNDITVTTNKGKEVVVGPSYYDNTNASPPYGTNSTNSDVYEFSFSAPDKDVGVFLKDSSQNIFWFNDDSKNFVGRISGVYEVFNSRTGDSAEASYTINVLPQPFDLSYSQIKLIDAYKNTFSFDLKNLGSVDWIALQRKLSNDVNWDDSIVGNWISVRDFDSSNIKIEDVINAEDYNRFDSDLIFNYRILAYEDQDGMLDPNEATGLAITSNVLSVPILSRDSLEDYTFSVFNTTSCSSPSPTIDFEIPQLTSSAGVYAKSYSVNKVSGSFEELTILHHNTGSADIPVTASVDRVSGCSGTYDRYFRVIGLSQDLMTTEYNVITASFDVCANVPVVKDIEVVTCLEDQFSGDLKAYVSNYSGELSAITFTEVGGPLSGLSLNSNGTFTFTPTSYGSVSFSYIATACGETSASGTFTFNTEEDCDICPDKELVSCRYALVNKEHPEFSGVAPFRFKDRHTSNIRLREEYEVKSNKS